MWQVHRAFLFAVLILSTGFLSADMTVRDNTAVLYKQKASDRLSIMIRNTLGQKIRPQLKASLDDIDLELKESGQQIVSALLLLIDSSDPRRSDSIRSQITHVEEIVNKLPDHILIGIARFDTELHLLAPLGSSKEKIIHEARSIRAEGKTTELYRNILGSINILKQVTADVKSILTMSDGLAEDYAYFHRDIVRSAIQNEINLYAIGYADNIPSSVALQTLRRLSEDTGGTYVAARPARYDLQQKDINEILSSLNSFSGYDIDLSAAIEANLTGKRRLQLSLQAPSGQILIPVPVTLPDNVEIQPRIEGIIPQPTVVIERVRESEEGTEDTIYWALLLLSILLAISIIVLLWRLRPRSNDDSLPRQGKEEDKEAPVIAWLEILDGEQKTRRYPIRSFSTKIGRYRENDIALPDSAISRYHAEIHLNNMGQFSIRDLGSKNGIQVNNQEIKEHDLQNNDVIEIGDIRLRFAVESTPAKDMQATQMFRTQFPST